MTSSLRMTKTKTMTTRKKTFPTTMLIMSKTEKRMRKKLMRSANGKRLLLFHHRLAQTLAELFLVSVGCISITRRHCPAAMTTTGKRRKTTWTKTSGSLKLAISTNCHQKTNYDLKSGEFTGKVFLAADRLWSCKSSLFRKQMMDEDKRKLLRYKEAYLHDGDGDSRAITYRFRWKRNGKCRIVFKRFSQKRYTVSPSRMGGCIQWAVRA